jgi:glyoxylase-like metal-dependent hydrolase (beta-lactamase superfamily II)
MKPLVEVAADVFVLRYPVLDVNATLVLGGEVAVVVDTLSTDAQAGELLAAVRAITPLPLVLVNTHAHFDHCFGNGVLADDCPGGGIWAHETAAAALRERSESLQREWYAEWLPTNPELAQGLAAVAVRPPDRTVHTLSTMDIGGRAVELRHFGRGHTDGDLVVSVPDADVLLAGDLVEEGAPPSFGDAYPLDWPETVAEMLQLAMPTTVVVPGHGAPVNLDFVRAQHEELTALAWLIRDGHADGATIEAVAAKAPFDRPTSQVAVRRGYAELAGRI